MIRRVTSIASRGVRFAVVPFLLLACGDSGSPKVPLGAPPPSAAEGPRITGEARAALDSANALFRVKYYDKARAEYERSASLAPTEMAPLLGLLMVADVTGDNRLGEATLGRIKRIDPAFADSTASSHSRIMKAHPVLPGPPSRDSARRL